METLLIDKLAILLYSSGFAFILGLFFYVFFGRK